MANKFTKGIRYMRALGLNCPYCRREMTCQGGLFPTKDHVVPQSAGGTNTVWACFDCNQVKADLMPQEWEEFRRQNPRWWKLPKGLAAKARKDLRAAA